MSAHGYMGAFEDFVQAKQPVSNSASSSSRQPVCPVASMSTNSELYCIDID